MSLPGLFRRNRVHTLSLLLKLSQPLLRRFCLCRQCMDAHVYLLGRRGGHQRLFVFGLQPFACNQGAKGAIHERILKLTYNISQMLTLERISKDAVHIPLIPPDGLPIRRQNHIFLSTPLKPFSFRPPALQRDFSRASYRALDINMNHWAIRIDPETDGSFLTSNRRVNSDASRLQIQCLPKL